MPKADVFPETFRTLRAILEQHRGKMIVTADTPTDYSLSSGTMTDRSGRPLFAAAVQIKKSYVSFHFMPIYVFPELRETLSPALKKRLRGTSKFTFTELDAPLLRELTALVKKGYHGYKRGGVFAA